jgi:hypothetical protein
MPDDEMTTAEKDELLHRDRSKGRCRDGRDHQVPEGGNRCAECGAVVEEETESRG